MKILLFTLLVISTACSRPPEHSDAKEETKSGPKLLEMTTQAQEHVGLRTIRASFRDMQEFLHVVGTVQPIDTRIGHVRPLTRGRVQSVDVRVGDRVRAGQALATFDNIEAGEVLAEYQGAVAELQRLKLQQASSERVSQRNKELSDLGAIAKKNAELSEVEAQSARDSVRVQESVVAGLASRLRRFGVEQVNVAHPSTVIRAPFAGVVIKAQTAPGDVFDAGRELFSIADLSHVWVQAEVYEQDLGRVKVGQSAVITVDTYPGEKIQGQVTYVGDILDPQTRTARVRCEVANPGVRLKLDMFAAIELPTQFHRRALVVPASALQDLNGTAVVFIRRSPTSFEPRAVKVGRTLEEDSEIQSGLSENEEVVSVGSFHLKSVALSSEIGEEE